VNEPRTIRIASRSSKLALWQAEAVKAALEKSGHLCEIITFESTGDIQLLQPIYALGISGVFTKQLDAALLNGDADIAVHSLKDVPTRLAQNLVLPAVLERGSSEDIAVVKGADVYKNHLANAVVGTSSLRRRAQWLAKYPNHQIVPIRGNVQTRLKKFEDDSQMGAVIFAKAGLERLNILPQNAVSLPWMLPAPAQGIIGIACRADDEEIKEICKGINHKESFMEGHVEREFLRALMGGCSVPISALASIKKGELHFDGAMHAFDGSRNFSVHTSISVTEWRTAGKDCADKMLQQLGAKELLDEIRNKKWDEEGALN
jgi:hydroxymethylbilane synthase